MANSASGAEFRRQALALRRDRSELRRCLANLLASAEDSAQQLEHWQNSRTLDQAATAPRKRKRFVEADSTLVPRFRLAAVSEEFENGEQAEILAVAAAVQDVGVMGVAVLTRQFLELWQTDPVCWHQTEAVKVPLPAEASAAVAFDRTGQDLWLVIFSPEGAGEPCGVPCCALETRLFNRSSEGKLHLKARLRGPLAPLLAGPAALDQAAAVAAAGAVHILSWHPEQAAGGGTLGATSFTLAWCGSRARPPSPACLEALPQQRLALVLRDEVGAGELQVYSDSGHCLAFVDLGAAACVVPPQDPCPTTYCSGLGLLLLLADQDQWRLLAALTAVAPQPANSTAPVELELRQLSSMSAPVEGLAVDAVSEGLVAYRAQGASWLLDWQQRTVQALPCGWRPLVVSAGTLILAHEVDPESRGFSEVVFLEAG
ncbi:unnamed protein product [Symbiodinium natans]|uniref:Uncharacterized protein n=1 Tax=Symbiodinium natans TaxID=878477 RepID=A0A812SM29_9DINO|nr:unnamed protein product [Symbiodinium natans]